MKTSNGGTNGRTFKSTAVQSVAYLKISPMWKWVLINTYLTSVFSIIIITCQTHIHLSKYMINIKSTCLSFSICGFCPQNCCYLSDMVFGMWVGLIWTKIAGWVSMDNLGKAASKINCVANSWLQKSPLKQTFLKDLMSTRNRKQMVIVFAPTKNSFHWNSLVSFLKYVDPHILKGHN